jgi:hypothetical protein
MTAKSSLTADTYISSVIGRASSGLEGRGGALRTGAPDIEVGGAPGSLDGGGWSRTVESRT